MKYGKEERGESGGDRRKEGIEKGSVEVTEKEDGRVGDTRGRGRRGEKWEKDARDLGALGTGERALPSTSHH